MTTDSSGLKDHRPVLELPAMKIAVIVLLLALLQTSCNTFIGVGRDLRQLGTGMENLGQRQW